MFENVVDYPDLILGVLAIVLAYIARRLGVKGATNKRAAQNLAKAMGILESDSPEADKVREVSGLIARLYRDDPQTALTIEEALDAAAKEVGQDMPTVRKAVEQHRGTPDSKAGR